MGTVSRARARGLFGRVRFRACVACWLWEGQSVRRAAAKRARVSSAACSAVALYGRRLMTSVRYISGRCRNDLSGSELTLPPQESDGISNGMQTMTHRTTFALDGTTASRLRRLSALWQVSQAEVVRRSLEQAEKQAEIHKPDPVAMLRRCCVPN